MRVLGPMAGAAIVAALTPNLFDSHPAQQEASGAASGPVDVPSRSAAVGAAVAVVLLDAYGVGAIWFVIVVLVGALAWTIARVGTITAIGTGLLMGAGTGMFVGVVSRRVRSDRGHPTDPVERPPS